MLGSATLHELEQAGYAVLITAFETIVDDVLQLAGLAVAIGEQQRFGIEWWGGHGRPTGNRTNAAAELARTADNPVEAGLVKWGRLWPGFTTIGWRLGAMRAFERPGGSRRCPRRSTMALGRTVRSRASRLTDRGPHRPAGCLPRRNPPTACASDQRHGGRRR